jgi:hypothetical protein
MESTNIKFAQYGGANECAKTDMLLLLLSEISTGAVSLSHYIVIAKHLNKLHICYVLFVSYFTSHYI